MRLVAVSIVKNEADIIEAFVRHTQAWVDHHLVFDHDSTDGTREILCSLQAEGLPLTLFQDNEPGHLQQARSNYLTRLAAKAQHADWVVPLDADEFLCGPGRTDWENALAQISANQPASLPLLDYCPTPADDPTELNPVCRLRHCRSAPSATRKIVVPRALALDADLQAGKGSHALYRGSESLPSLDLPDEYHLAHLALRSPQQQLLRVVRAELQRLSRGQAARRLDVHYRLGYQLLAEDPELFFATVSTPAANLRVLPIDYRGGALHHTKSQDWSRVARALLPYLETLATSHGTLADAAGVDVAAPDHAGWEIREFTQAEAPTRSVAHASGQFIGFVPVSGWGPQEGPVPEAFLPQFHWGYAPATVLMIEAPDGEARTLCVEFLTYSENQTVGVELNGVVLRQHAFVRPNQRERLAMTLPLRPGSNQLTFHYSQSLVTAYDARRLAVIWLGLGLLPAGNATS